MVFNLMNHIGHRVRPRGLPVFAKPLPFVPTSTAKALLPLMRWYPKAAGLYNYIPATLVFVGWFAWPALGDYNRQYLKSLVFLAERPVREE